MSKNLRHPDLLYLILLPFGLIISTNEVRAINLFIIGLIALQIILSVCQPGFNKRLSKLFVIVSFVLMTLSIFIISGNAGQKIIHELSNDPGEEFTTDMRGFLKTYYLMKSDTPFIQAFPKAMSIAFASSFKIDLAGWREPFIFTAWTILPGNGSSIYYLAAIFYCLDLLCAYLIARKYMSGMTALLSPLLLLPYFQLPLTDLSVLQIEWWGLHLLLIGIVFYLYKRYLLAGVFLALTLAARETFAVPIVSLLALHFITDRKKTLAITVLPIILFGAYYVLSYLPSLAQYQADLVRSIRFGDWHLIRSTFAYSSWNYFVWPIRPFLLLLLITTGGLILSVYKRVTRNASLKLLTLYIPTLVAITFFALTGRMTRWHDYWGIYFVPILIIIAPISLKLFLDSLRMHQRSS